MRLTESPLVVVDTRLLMYFLHHRKGKVLGVTNLVAEKYFSVLSIPPRKVVFAMDKGDSFRKNIFKDYKAHRRERDKKLSKVDKDRLNAFNKLYQKIPDFLRNYGNVMQVPSIEADDIASALSFGIDTNKTPIVFLTSDEDWVKFMKDGVYLAHVEREELYSFSDIEHVYGYKPEWKVHIDCVTGVSKENVPGITKLGKTRATSLLQSVEGDIEQFLLALEQFVAEGKYGMKLPEQFSSVQELYEFNKVLFSPLSFSDFHSDVVNTLKTQYAERPSKSVNAIVDSSMSLMDTIYYPTEKEVSFYGLKRD